MIFFATSLERSRCFFSDGRVSAMNGQNVYFQKFMGAPGSIQAMEKSISILIKFKERS